MAISKELQNKLDYYEQIYFGLDTPIPFKDGLEIYPVLVKDYYAFYNCLNCITMDKNVKTIIGEDGRPKKVSNPKGIGQSYLDYLIDTMVDEGVGAMVTSQVMNLFELVFHIQKGMYCPNCGKEITYQQAFSGINEFIKNSLEEAKTLYSASVNTEDAELPEEIKKLVEQKARVDYFKQMQVCPDCEGQLRDIFSIKNTGGKRTLSIRNVEITSTEFDELKAIIPRQNIIDYDGDKYMDYELKEELELKAQLQNKDYTSPTLEKQLVCVGIATGYSLEYLKGLPMRKLSLMLRSVDRMNTYYAQLQASMSGLVTFKEDPKHWIFSDDKKNIKDELTSLDDFTKKFDNVV